MSHEPTLLITGCSSGFGLETARLFLARGWRVVATMRTPDAGLLPASPRLRILPLDVNDEESVRRCIAEAGPLDALVNNAGVGLRGPLETQGLPLIRQTLDTNVLGTVAMTQAVIPQMRERGRGVIVNVTSVVTLQSMPLLAAYTASKAAVDALTRSLALELAPFGIRTRLVLPGRAPGTRFGPSAQGRAGTAIPAAYAALLQPPSPPPGAAAPLVTEAAEVAEAVWRAVTDPSAPMRLPAGADAVVMARELGVEGTEDALAA